jgi:pyruvate-ferredoxin/flavodoxin oxidoreductase
VAQTSISEPKHFYESVRGALGHKGPALVRIHAPSPKRHGFETDGALEHARLAVTSRALPLFCYDPSAEGIYGSRLSLTGNPEPESAWATDENNVPFTPADWALGEKRFSQMTPPLEEDAPAPTPVSGYLLLPMRDRAGKTPFVVDADGNRRKVTAELARTVEARLGTWQALQEVAGLVTPFTRAVREEAEQAVADAHQAELQTVRDDYETQLKTGREQSEAEITERIKNQLLVLTGYKK